jgi:hypothetical protein
LLAWCERLCGDKGEEASNQMHEALGMVRLAADALGGGGAI